MVKEHIIKKSGKLTLCGKNPVEFPQARIIIRETMNLLVMKPEETDKIHKACLRNANEHLNTMEEKFSREKEQLENINKWLLNDDHNPTKTYKGKVGKLIISEVFENGLYYYSKKEGYLRWDEVYDNFDNESSVTSGYEELGKPNRFMRNKTYNKTIDSMLFDFARGDLKLNPVYQREKIWDLQDKRSLIESILNEIPIGTLALRIMPYPHENDICEEYENNTPKTCVHWDYYYHYEIVDGKQRFSTIFEFIHNQFSYEGLLFKELHVNDRSRIKNLILPTVEGSYNNTQDILEWFIALNTMGKPQKSDHLEKIKEQFREK